MLVNISDPTGWSTVLSIFLEQGVLGATTIVFLVLWMRERQDNIKMAKSFNRQLKNVNECRAKEVRQTSEALQAASDSNHMLAHIIERLHDFLIQKRIGE